MVFVFVGPWLFAIPCVVDNFPWNAVSSLATLIDTTDNHVYPHLEHTLPEIAHPLGDQLDDPILYCSSCCVLLIH